MVAKAFRYPVVLSPDAHTVMVEFPDVPGALTQGADETDALEQASDCLIAALGAYIELRRDIPPPSPARGRPTVTLPPLVAAKLALYQAMREAKMTNVALAKRLGCSETLVRRLLDLDHRSHIGQIESALAALGKRLVVEVWDAA